MWRMFWHLVFSNNTQITTFCMVNINIINLMSSLWLLSSLKGYNQLVLTEFPKSGCWGEEMRASSLPGSWCQDTKRGVENATGKRRNPIKCAQSSELLLWVTGAWRVWSLYFKNGKEKSRELLSHMISLKLKLGWEGESYALSRSLPILWLYDCSLSKIGW